MLKNSFELTPTLNKYIINKTLFSIAFTSLIFFTVLPTIVFTQVTYDANQTWSWLHPQPQGNVFRWCKMWDRNTWYIAGNFGTFMKTSNGGSSWYITYNAGKLTGSDGRLSDINDAYFFDQNTGMVIGNFGTARKTTNAGSNSVIFDSIPNLSINTSWNHIFFLNNSTGYLAGNLGNVAKTTNAGNDWTFITSIAITSHFDLWTPNDTLIIVSSAAGNIQRSTDGGVSWLTINTGTAANLLKLCFVNQYTGFACGTSGAVRLTTDAGLNWSGVNTGLPLSNYNDIDSKINGPNTEVYLTGNAYYVYKTTNLGTSWDTVGFWGSNQSYMGSFQNYSSTELAGGDTLLTVGSFSLINKRNNNSNKILYPDFVKFGPADVNDLWVNGSKIWAVGSSTGQLSVGGPTDDQIIFTSDGGNTWDKQSFGNSTALFTSICMVNDNTGYVAGLAGVIRKTIDGGTNWDPIVSPTANDLRKVEFIDANTGWVFGILGVIYKTTNGGANWVLQTPSGFGGGGIHCADMLNANTGWIVGSSSTTSAINKTTDGGLNWLPQNPNISVIPPPTIFSIKMLDDNTGYFAGPRNIRKTTNGGLNWDSIPFPIPSNTTYQITGLDFINSETGMLLFNFLTLKTTNGGTSWIIDYIGTISGPSSAPTKLKMVSQDTAYLGGNLASVLKYTSNTIGIIEWQNNVPMQYELEQNYPNPFNPVTNIKFAIPKAGNVTLKVHDITGKEVITILNNFPLNPGTYRHTFDGNIFSSGVYFYSLYVDNNLIKTRKMILLK